MGSLRIDTPRLRLIPFTLDFVEALIRGEPRAYDLLDVRPDADWPEPDLREALPVFAELLRTRGVTGYGPWLVLFLDRRIVGSAGFIGEPQNGELEIGFGVLPSRQNQGLATEAVKGLLAWAWKQPGVDRVIAHSDSGNTRSARVLEKTGFKCTGQPDGLCAWVCRSPGSS